MDTLQENAWEIILNKLSSSTTGIIFMCVIALLIATAKACKFLFPIIKEKIKRNEKKKEKEAKAEKEYRDSIHSIAKHLPELDQQVSTLSTEVGKLKDLRNEWMRTSIQVKETILELKSDLKELSDMSSDEDKKLSESLNETRNMITETRNTTKKIENDMLIMFEGDNNEFRLYLTFLHEKHVIQHEPMTREEKKRLRIKFDSYEKRGGNGWAKELYKELMALPIEGAVNEKVDTE